jgi:superfamily II DNA or RNA helicase
LGDVRASLKATTGVDRQAYRTIVDHLRRYRFWTEEYGAYPQVWDHQQTATCLLSAYLSADRAIPRDGIKNEAALVKMATGAGKSAVIAMISRCFPSVRRVLIVTPRTALTEQIYTYIHSKFWQTMGLAVAPRTAYFDAKGDEAGAPVESAYIAHLLPSTVRSILDHAPPPSERVVLAGTLQALDHIRRTAEKRLGQDDAKNQQIVEAGRMLEMIGGFDLVVVDEGHYEPAISWSRAIRQADLPTVLFSATPYRNDYKSFRVRGRFVFNQSIQEALARRIIRTPQFAELALVGAPAATPLDPAHGPQVLAKDAADEDDVNDRELTDQEKADAHEFVRHLSRQLRDMVIPKGMKNWKVIVRAERLQKLILLQTLLKELTDRGALVVHHAVKPKSQGKMQFQTVKSAQANDGSDETLFWLHETKLLEGVDDPSFIAVAIYDNFGNARQLVQQIGRVLRSSDASRQENQAAYVLARSGHIEAIKESWARYLEFEDYCATNTQHVVISEAAFPDRLIETLPDLQYVEGQFRPRYLLDRNLGVDDIQLPASAAVFDFNGVDFDKPAVREEISEAILGNDRFQPVEILGLPDNVVAVAYYGWRTSPWLTRHFFPEWTLGVCILVRLGDLVFAHDTAGIVFDSSKLEISRIDQDVLARGIPASTNDRKVRVIRMSSASLDMSERAIRAQAIRTASFEDTFTDLLDPGMFPTSAFGRVGLYGRYLGFTQARVRDSRPTQLPLRKYLEWVEEVARDIRIESQLNPVFGRYAKLVAAPDKENAKPKNVLIDLGDSFEDYRGQDDRTLRIIMQDVDNPDLCSNVDEDGRFHVTIAGKQFPCEIEYREATHRYAISSANLDAYFQAASAGGRRSAFTITELLNRTQSFRVIPALEGVVYANGKFYRPQGLDKRDDGTFPQLDNLVAIPILESLKTEKGEKIYPVSRAAWRAESQFGMIKAICEISPGDPIPDEYGILGKELAKFDLVICDDDGNEVGDFLAIDSERRLVCIIHAKASDSVSRAAVSAIQVVGRQALASLAFCSAISVTPKVSEERWGTEVNANGKTLDGLHRIFKNSGNLSLEQARALMLSALRNKSWNREIWIVASRLLDRKVLESRLGNGDPGNLLMQTSMFLASLTTSCSRAGARLRIFCHASEIEDGEPKEPDLLVG